ncbi:MAG: MFS transporter [Candidatus Hodarchaeales archaeon]|jgi:DHA3 family macrolide efflux protein-like MFS transporter
MNHVKSYLLFLTGQVQSQLGSIIVQFVIILWITLEYQSTFYLGLASFVGFAPMVIATLFTGVLVDRYNRKVIIVIVDFLQALVTLLLVYLFWTEMVTIIHILLILAIRAFLQAFHMPATEAIVPLMVPKDKLSRINGLRQFSDGASGVIGPVLAVFLLNYWEIRVILLLDPLTFILAIIPVLFIKIPAPKRKKEEKEKLAFKAEFSEGISFILEKPGLLPLVLLFSVLNFFFNPLFVLLPMFVIQTHAKGKDEIALMMVFLQIGYITGSIFMMLWKGFKRKIFGTILAMVGIYIGMLIITIVPPGTEFFYIIGIGFSIVGLTLVILNSTILTLYHSVIPPEKLGRFTAVRRTIIWFTIPISSLFSGIIAEYLDIRLIFFICVVLGLIAIVYSWLMTKIPELEHYVTKPYTNSVSQASN